MQTIEKFVTYEAFGAVGDGKHNDLEAIVNAHKYANEAGLAVRASDDAVYYLGGNALTATIKTDVNFGSATFIIDDRLLENINSDIFSVQSDYQVYTPEISAVTAGQEKIDFPHQGNAYVRIYNSDRKIFKRMGENANSGVDASDCFVVDDQGNIKNRIDLDYPTVTRVYAKCIDDKPITIEGGTFITYANNHERVYKYHRRGFYITRSNVTVSGLTHLIEKEGEDGAPYAGFLSVNEAVNIVICDCLLTPHKTYLTKDSNPPIYVNRMGSYDLNFNATIDAKLIRVRQSRDILDRSYWGLIGTNFCKNFYVDSCEMSRFDAHMGVSDATIKNSRIGHQCLQLIGYGEFYIENSFVLGDAFISLRADYGSTWNGNITVKNCTWEPKNKNRLSVFSAVNHGTHDFGYIAKMPQTITIDGLKILDGEIDENIQLYILPNYDPEFEPDKPFAYIPTKKLTATAISTELGRSALPYANKAQYKELEFEIN